MVKDVKLKRDKGLHERIVVLANKDLYDWLQAQSESTGAPVGAIVRRAVEAYRQRLVKPAAKS
jgi:hypothetical protein